MGSIDSDVHAELAAVHAELTAALAEIDRLRGLLGLDRPEPQPVPDGRLFSLDTPADRGSDDAAVTRASTAEQKLALFRQRFADRRVRLAVGEPLDRQVGVDASPARRA